MSLAAAAIPLRTLADAVDELFALVPRQGGGECLWCGSQRLRAETQDGATTGAPRAAGTIICEECGSELIDDRPRPTWGPQA